MEKRSAAGLFWLVVLLGGCFVGMHLAWECCDGLAFPESHSERFMRYPLYCAEWMRSLPGETRAWLSGASPLAPRLLPPATFNYPPLSFVVSGAAMLLFGQKVMVLRLAQDLFAVGLIAAMGRIGWRVAGARGAVLLALGVTTAVWTSEYARIYTQDLGQMFFLALLVLLTMESEGLTRPRACLGLGVVFGLGMLTKYYFVLLGLPLLLVAAAPGFFSSRASVQGALAVLAMASQLVTMTWWGMKQTEASLGKVTPEGLPVDYSVPLVLGAEGLFLVGLLLARHLARGRAALPPGVGLLLVASTCGLVCAPWYFSRMDLWFWVLEAHTLAVPEATGSASWVSEAGRILANGLDVLDSFYWGGRFWLGLGTILLLTWREKGPFVRFITLGAGVIVGLNVFLLLPDPRYQAPMLPLLVLLAFLGAARSRATFAACATFMLVAGTLQAGGWLPGVARLARAAGLELKPISESCPHALPVPFDLARQPLDVVPVAEPPTWTPGVLDALPRGARLGVLSLHPVGTQRPEPLLFRAWLRQLGQVVPLDPSADISTSGLDRVVAISWDLPPPPLELETAPRRYRVWIKDLDDVEPRLEVRDLWFDLYTCGSAPGSLGPVVRIPAPLLRSRVTPASPPPAQGSAPAPGQAPPPPAPLPAFARSIQGLNPGRFPELVRNLPRLRGQDGALRFQSGQLVQEVRISRILEGQLRVGGGFDLEGRVTLDGREVPARFVITANESREAEVNTIYLPGWATEVPYRWSQARGLWVAGYEEPTFE